MERPLAPEADTECGKLILGAELLVDTIDKLDTITPQPQNDAEAIHAPMIRKEMGAIDWTQPAERVHDLVRGLNPWPSAYTSYAGKTMKIWAADVAGLPGERTPGKIHVTKNQLFVETGDGVLDVKELQLEGKKRMDTASFLRGFQMEDGSFCG